MEIEVKPTPLLEFCSVLYKGDKELYDRDIPKKQMPDLLPKGVSVSTKGNPLNALKMKCRISFLDADEK